MEQTMKFPLYHHWKFMLKEGIVTNYSLGYTCPFFPSNKGEVYESYLKKTKYILRILWLETYLVINRIRY